MSRKLQTIQALKGKLLKMQRNLQDLTNKSNIPQPVQDDFKSSGSVTEYQSTPIARHTPKNQSWKNPTFWGNSPIFGKQNDRHQKWQKNKQSRSPRQLSPKLTHLQQKTDQQYYNSGCQSSEETEVIKYFPSKRYENSHYGFAERETPRFEKIKTYNPEQISKILNLSGSVEFKKSGRRIVSPISRSPKNLYTNNPKSDPLMYFFKDRQTSLSPKSCYTSKKNTSPNMTQIMSPNKPMKIKNPSKSNKRHFKKYFHDNFELKWK